MTYAPVPNRVGSRNVCSPRPYRDCHGTDCPSGPRYAHGTTKGFGMAVSQNRVPVVWLPRTEETSPFATQWLLLSHAVPVPPLQQPGNQSICKSEPTRAHTSAASCSDVRHCPV
ncbi:hypothetical protein VTK26DRAFT_7439 [Humicola hyalothermophila]